MKRLLVFVLLATVLFSLSAKILQRSFEAFPEGEIIPLLMALSCQK